MSLVDAAQEYISEGLNPLPLKADKSPKLPTGHPFLYEPIDKVDQRFSKCEMIGIACGTVSGGFYCLDFDKHQGQRITEIFDGFFNDERVQYLIAEDQLCFYKSPSGGYHCYFRNDQTHKGSVLSRWENGSTMIEFRGNGQYIACTPSLGYQYIAGCEIVKLNRIEIDDCNYIIDLALSQNQDKNYKEKADSGGRTWPEKWDNSTLEGQFNNESANEVKSLLESIGWVMVNKRRHDGVELWQRPGKGPRDGISATFGAKFNMFYVFSSNAQPFVENTAYNPFSIYTLIKFDGDWKKAKDSLRPARIESEEEEIKISTNFPIEVFPEFIQQYISELNKTLNFHPDFLAAAVLFTVATLSGNKYKLQVKKGWEAAPIFWFACVGFPGTIKTHPLKAITRPLTIIDAENKKLYDDEMAHWNPEATPRQPKPKFRQLLISDYTIEALHHIHEFNKRGIGLYKDELNGFLNDMNKYRKGSDLEFWLESFNNGSYIVNRATKEPILITDICINMIGTIQHEVLSSVISQYSGNGFVDRFLFTAPENKVYPLNNLEISEDFETKWEWFVRKLNQSFVYFDKDSTETIRMSPEAFQKYQQLDQEYVAIQSAEQTSRGMKNYLSKMKTYVPRFALLLSIIQSMEENLYIEVTVKHMEDAGKIADYFIGTAKETFQINSEQAEIKQLVSSYKGLTRNEQIKKLHDKGIKQTHLALFFGVSRPTIAKILKNKV